MKIGVLGCGHLGKFHIQQLIALPEWELVGFYDPNPEIAKTIAEKHQIRFFSSVDELIDAVDVVDIVTPTLSHYDCAKKAIRKCKHVFIEKPITNTVAEARELISLSAEAKVKVQVGQAMYHLCLRIEFLMHLKWILLKQ